jgi:hypothetical protein
MATRNIMSVLPWWNPAAALDRAFHGMPRAIAFNGLKPRNDARSRHGFFRATDNGGRRRNATDVRFTPSLRGANGSARSARPDDRLRDEAIQQRNFRPDRFPLQ